MKMDLDCIREILLTIESQNNPMKMSPNEFCSLIPNYDEVQIIYCCRKLFEGNYINLFFLASYGEVAEKDIQNICDLTFQGHQFLETIKPKTVWEETKSLAGNIGSFSIDVLTKIAANVLTQMINKQFL